MAGQNSGKQYGCARSLTFRKLCSLQVWETRGNGFVHHWRTPPELSPKLQTTTIINESINWSPLISNSVDDWMKMWLIIAGYEHYLSSGKNKDWKNSGFCRSRTHDLCGTFAMLYQLSSSFCGFVIKPWLSATDHGFDSSFKPQF